MRTATALKVTTPTDVEIVMTRAFDAPRRLVWDAMTRPDLVRRWMFTPPGWKWAECDMDVRVGGKFRWVWNGPDGRVLLDCSVRGCGRVRIPVAGADRAGSRHRGDTHAGGRMAAPERAASARARPRAAGALALDNPSGTLTVVVIDGLDEATGWYPTAGTFPMRPGEAQTPAR